MSGKSKVQLAIDAVDAQIAKLNEDHEDALAKLTAKRDGYLELLPAKKAKEA